MIIEYDGWMWYDFPITKEGGSSMSDNQIEEILKLLREINEKLDRIVYKEMNVTAEELQEIKCYVRNISTSK